MTRTYKTLAGSVQFTYEEKRSRFIAGLWPVTEKEILAERLRLVRQEHPEARHICSAYVFGDPLQATAAGFNDDGEPKGTAGKPMLNVLMQRRLGDAAAIVVRYFGGVKLGAGGLARAYGQAVSGAVDLAQFEDVVAQRRLQMTVEFALEERVRHLLQQAGAGSPTCEYREQVTLSCLCPAHLIDEVQERLRHGTAGRIIFSLSEK